MRLWSQNKNHWMKWEEKPGGDLLLYGVIIIHRDTKPKRRSQPVETEADGEEALCVRSGERVEKHGWELRVEMTGVGEMEEIGRKADKEGERVQAMTRANQMMMKREVAIARSLKLMRWEKPSGGSVEEDVLWKGKNH